MSTPQHQTTLPASHPLTDWTPEQREESGRRRSFLMTAPRIVHPDGSQCLQREWCQQAHRWATRCSCGADFKHASKKPVKEWKIRHGVEHADLGEACW